MKFRPTLESLDGRIVPSATQPPTLPPLELDTATAARLRQMVADSRIDQFNTLLDQFIAASDRYGSDHAYYQNCLAGYQSLVDGSAFLIALIGQDQYQQLLQQAANQINSLYDSLEQQRVELNSMTAELNGLMRDPLVYPSGPPGPPLPTLPQLEYPPTYPPLPPLVPGSTVLI